MYMCVSIHMHAVASSQSTNEVIDLLLLKLQGVCESPNVDAVKQNQDF